MHSVCEKKYNCIICLEPNIRSLIIIVHSLLFVLKIRLINSYMLSIKNLIFLLYTNILKNNLIILLLFK